MRVLVDFDEVRKEKGLTLEQDKITWRLNQAKYLNLRHISEPEENSLRLVVEELIADHSESMQVGNGLGPFSELATGTWPIRRTDECETFELHWSRYVAYLVTEEIVGSAGSHEDEVYTGNLLRVYTKSHFLEYLARDTSGHSEPILHYKLICQNHLIDVACYSPPDMRLLGRFEGDAEKRIRPN